MITKKHFCELLRQFKQLVDDAHGVHNALKKLDPDFGGLFLGRHETAILELIKELAEDNVPDSWVSHWVYEQDFGKDAEKFGVWCHKEAFILSTPEKLFDFMVHKCPDISKGID